MPKRPRPWLIKSVYKRCQVHCADCNLTLSDLGETSSDEDTQNRSPLQNNTSLIERKESLSKTVDQSSSSEAEIVHLPDSSDSESEEEYWANKSTRNPKETDVNGLRYSEKNGGKLIHRSEKNNNRNKDLEILKTHELHENQISTDEELFKSIYESDKTFNLKENYSDSSTEKTEQHKFCYCQVNGEILSNEFEKNHFHDYENKEAEVLNAPGNVLFEVPLRDVTSTNEEIFHNTSESDGTIVLKEDCLSKSGELLNHLKAPVTVSNEVPLEDQTNLTKSPRKVNQLNAPVTVSNEVPLEDQTSLTKSPRKVNQLNAPVTVSNEVPLEDQTSLTKSPGKVNQLNAPVTVTNEVPLEDQSNVNKSNEKTNQLRTPANVLNKLALEDQSKLRKFTRKLSQFKGPVTDFNKLVLEDQSRLRKFTRKLSQLKTPVTVLNKLVLEDNSNLSESTDKPNQLTTPVTVLNKLVLEDSSNVSESPDEPNQLKTPVTVLNNLALEDQSSLRKSTRKLNQLKTPATDLNEFPLVDQSNVSRSTEKPNQLKAPVIVLNKLALEDQTSLKKSTRKLKQLKTPATDLNEVPLEHQSSSKKSIKKRNQLKTPAIGVNKLALEDQSSLKKSTRKLNQLKTHVTVLNEPPFEDQLSTDEEIFQSLSETEDISIIKEKTSVKESSEKPNSLKTPVVVLKRLQLEVQTSTDEEVIQGLSESDDLPGIKEKNRVNESTDKRNSLKTPVVILNRLPAYDLETNHVPSAARLKKSKAAIEDATVERGLERSTDISITNNQPSQSEKKTEEIDLKNLSNSENEQSNNESQQSSQLKKPTLLLKRLRKSILEKATSTPNSKNTRKTMHPEESSSDCEPIRSSSESNGFLESDSDAMIPDIDVRQISEKIETFQKQYEDIAAKFKYINIPIDWELPDVHKLPKGLRRSRDSDATKGKLTREEAEYLEKRFHSFLEENNLNIDEFRIVSQRFLGCKIPNEMRIKFIQYLCKDLTDRAPLACYSYISRLGLRKGRFTEKEDNFLIDMYQNYTGNDIYSLCGLLLNRNRYNIYRRLKRLKARRDIGSRAKEKKSKKNMAQVRAEVLGHLLRIWKKDKGKLGSKLSQRMWISIARNVGVSPALAKGIYLCEINPTIHAQHPIYYYQFSSRLITRLYEDKIMTWDEVPWTKLSNQMQEVGPMFIYFLLRKLIKQNVPSSKWNDLRGCVKRLYEKVLPNYREISTQGDYIMKRIRLKYD